MYIKYNGYLFEVIKELEYEYEEKKIRKDGEEPKNIYSKNLYLIPKKYAEKVER